MCLTDKEKTLIEALFEGNRIPLFLFGDDLTLVDSFILGLPENITNLLSKHMKTILQNSSNKDFDILSRKNELYYIFSFYRNNEKYYLLAGPMMLSSFVHIQEMRSLSFSSLYSISDLKILVDNLPVVTLSSFGSSLRIMMLLLNEKAPTLDEISHIKSSDIEGILDKTVIREVFENMENFRSHTPYREELAVLKCVKAGDPEALEETYRTLPKIKYGNMSNNPLRLLFYGCIANTTLVTRFAIEGGLDEETAFTLSDVYIKKMEDCTTFYDLNMLNEKMALDFTRRVAKAKEEGKKEYIKPIADCIDFIGRNLSSKISLCDLAQNVHMNSKYLSHLFRSETGKTITEYIEEQRIEKAKMLLTYSNYSYNEISDSLAFYSQSYFISVFKKRVNMTPKEYRNKFSKAESALS